MRLLVISSAPIVILNEKEYLYGPYQKEMKIWAKYANEIQFCCPIWKEDKGLLIDQISFSNSSIVELNEFDVKSIAKLPRAIYFSIINFFIIVKSMRHADHIHLRCPGNMALLACFAQILFPNKTKTAKYAGNWDPKAKQPFTYKLQRYILSNTFLTKNMQVLVYGDWPNQTKNIKPFFTASYSEKEIQNSEFRIQKKHMNEKIHFLFVGTLSLGKQPLYALQLVEALHKKGYSVQLGFYGDGKLKEELQHFIIKNSLQDLVFLKGNQSKETILKAYQLSHFLILPSKSEGWPKVVAEAMFWGCLPLATKISCVPYMLDYGKRGVLLEEHLDKDVSNIQYLIENENKYQAMTQNAQNWSREYTLEFFEAEIKKLLL
jgi:glycosyltransferase involved in cell wall biosynthesis